MNLINNQAALVTGAGRRIGAAIASALHGAGFRLAVHCHHSWQEANQLVEKMNRIRPDSARVFQVDLTKDLAALVTAVQDWAPLLSILVNNASLFLADTDENLDWDTLFHLNAKVPFFLSHAFKTRLSQNQGSIVNITDIHAQIPLKNYAIYCQSKAALALQTKALAREFAPDLRVNAVAPGAIAWPEQQNALSEALKNKIISKTPLKRHGSAQCIAEAVLALVHNTFITGQTLAVDGGRSINY